ncbi:hypothetical protein KC946_00105 [Candidatus Saccharibacteria bacterium]|nr:hypothetical protein [Candidatus Saccharibacteria bacterium]
MESDKEEFQQWLSDNGISEDVLPHMGEDHGHRGHGPEHEMRGEQE